MSYTVKEIFLTLQGEGAQAGRTAVFCRFSGCNLWTGREPDRSKAICRFCDTQFVGGDKFRSADLLSASIDQLWPRGQANKFVVCTGGEPLLQLDKALISSLHMYGYEIAVETNGTKEVPEGVDWVCVSPKAGAPLVATRGSELKLVYPQPDLMPSLVAELDFEHFFLQPMDGPDREKNTTAAIEYCTNNPQWRLSIQTHKLIGLR